MNLFDRFNAWLSKLVGPNSAHTIDAGLAYAIGAAVVLCASPWARAEASHHALLGTLFGAGILLGTPLISKFRKAAGKPSTDLVDSLATLVEDALARHGQDASTAAAQAVTDAITAGTVAAPPPDKK